MSPVFNGNLRLLLVLVLIFISSLGFAQTKEVDELQERANILFEQRNYLEAKDLYSQLVSLYPKDENYNYRFGACLMYVDEDKAYPIKFLEYAVSKPNVDVDAFYFLGKGYHYNYRFNEAITYFNKYKDKLSHKNKSKYPVDQDIRFCENGKLLLRNITTPLVMKRTKVSAADFFTSFKIQDMGGRMLYAPKELHSSVDKKKGYVPVMYKNDNSNIVYFSSYGDNDKNGLDLFQVFVANNGELGKPVRLPETINTKYDERFPFLTEDQTKFYFSSTGHNSMGGADIYVSSFDKMTKSFGAPVNLDYSVNTPDDDFMYAEVGDEGIAFFASNRNCEKGKAFVYKINAQRKHYEIAVLAGFFISDDTKSCKITVEDLEDHIVVGTFNTNKKSGQYVMRLKNGGKYSFLVEPYGGEVAYKGRVELPHQNEIKVLRQEILIVKDDAGERLIIRNLFEEESAPGDQKIIAQVFAENANMEETKEPEITISPKQMVTQLEKTKVIQEKKMQELVAQKEASYLLANSKRELAHKDLELADQLEKQIDLMNNSNETKKQQKEFAELIQDARVHSIEAEAAFEIGRKYETQISEAQTQLNQTEGYLMRIKSAVHENSSAAATELYTNFQNNKVEIGVDQVGQNVESDIEREEAKMNRFIAKAATLEELQADLKNDISTAKATKRATKKKKEKEAIQLTIENLQEEIEPLAEDKKSALATASEIELTINALRHERALLNEVKSTSTHRNENSERVTEDQKVAMLASIQATSHEIDAMEQVSKEMVSSTSSETQMAENDDGDVQGVTQNEVSTENGNMEPTGSNSELSATEEFAILESETGSELPISNEENLEEGVVEEAVSSSEEEVNTFLENAGNENFEATTEFTEAGKSETQEAENNLEPSSSSSTVNAGGTVNMGAENGSVALVPGISTLLPDGSDGSDGSEGSDESINSNSEEVFTESNNENSLVNNERSDLEGSNNSIDNENTINGESSELSVDSKTLTETSIPLVTSGESNSITESDESNSQGQPESEYFEYTQEYEEPVTEVVMVEGERIPLEITSNTGKVKYKEEELKNAKVNFSNSAYNEGFEAQYASVKQETNQSERAKETQRINYNWVVAIEKEIAELSYAKQHSSHGAITSRINVKMEELQDQASQKRNFMALNSRIIKQLDAQEEMLVNANTPSIDEQTSPEELNNQLVQEDGLDTANTNTSSESFTNENSINEFLEESVAIPETNGMNIEELANASEEVAVSNANESPLNSNPESFSENKEEESTNENGTENELNVASTANSVQIEGNEITETINEGSLLEQNESIVSNDVSSNGESGNSELLISENRSDLNTENEIALTEGNETVNSNESVANNESENLEPVNADIDENSNVGNELGLTENPLNSSGNNEAIVSNDSETTKETTKTESGIIESTQNGSTEETAENTVVGNETQVQEDLGNENEVSEASHFKNSNSRLNNETSNLMPIQDSPINPSAVVVSQIELETEEQEVVVKKSESKRDILAATIENTKKKKEKKRLVKELAVLDAEVAYENKKLQLVQAKKEDANSAQKTMVADPLGERPSEMKLTEARKVDAKTGDLESELMELEYTLENTKKKKHRRVIETQIIHVKQNISESKLASEMAKESASEMAEIETETLKKLTPYGTEVLIKLPEIENRLTIEQFEEVESKSEYIQYMEVKKESEKDIQTAAVMYQSSKNKKVEAIQMEEELSVLNEALELLPEDEKAPIQKEIVEKRKVQKRIIEEAEVMYQEARLLENEAYFNLNEANAKLLVLDNATDRTLIMTAISGYVQAPMVDLNYDSTNIDAIPMALTTDIFVENDTTFYDETKPIPVGVTLPNGVVLKVQIGAFRNPINQSTFKGFAPIVGEKTASGLTRYTAGLFKDFVTANNAKDGIRSKGYSDAFIVAYLDGKRISISEARRVLSGEINASDIIVSSTPQNTPIAPPTQSVQVTEINSVPLLPGQGDIEVKGTSSREELFFTVQVGVYSQTIQPGSVLGLTPLNSEKIPNNLMRYSSGVYGSIAQASLARSRIVQFGILDAFVTAYYQGNRIPLAEARALIANGTVQGTSTISTTQKVNTTPSNTEDNLNRNTEISNSGIPTYFVSIGPYSGGIPIQEAREILGLNSLGVVIEKNNNATLYKIGNFTNRQDAEMLKIDLVAKGLTNPVVKKNEE